MKKMLFLVMITLIGVLTSCSKSDGNAPVTPRTEVPQELRGSWMYGNFSMTEYWDQYPGDYIGNGFEVAFAFTFNADGTFTQYFTASSVTGSVKTYHQSVSKGTVEVNTTTQTIVTHTTQAHYRRTVGTQVAEDRDMDKDEYDPDDSYTYTTGVEPSGTEAIYLTLEGTTDPLTFLKK